MPTVTVENYLKTLYLQQQRSSQGKPVAMGKLADAMDVAPGTATAMIKTLRASGLVSYTPRGGARLTPRGEALALHVLRRHRLVELFLVAVLNLDWTEVHEEAEELEHAISDKVLDRIDALLGHPSVDPHGDPIPPAKGKLKTPALLTLSEAQSGSHVRVARIVDQSPLFLKFVQARGLTPGSTVHVLAHDMAADAITVQAGRHEPSTLGTVAAAKVLVEVTGGRRSH
jgi:DtxR family Mn-dependent transcriptional regulator